MSRSPRSASWVTALHLDKSSKGAQAYLALAGEMLRREEAAQARAHPKTQYECRRWLSSRDSVAGWDALLLGVRRNNGKRCAEIALDRSDSLGRYQPRTPADRPR